MSQRGRAALRALLPLVGSAVALVWTLSRLDTAAIGAALAGADLRWLAAAAALGPLQVALVSWRWWLVAGLLGAPLSWRQAFSEYYLSTALNQVLPGGVAGDALRVLRHGGRERRYGPAVRAALLDRLAGQAALAVVALAGLLCWPALHGTPPPWWGAAAAAGLLAVPVAAAAWPSPRPAALAALARDARTALLSPGRRWLSAALSLGATASFLAGFAAVAAALGTAPGAVTITAAPLVLVAMTIPISVGGWGIREAAAAALFEVTGQPPELGVALSALYGLTVLAGALPGAAALLPGRRWRAALAAVGRHPATAPAMLLALNTALLLPRILARPERFVWLPRPEGWSPSQLWRFALRRDSEDLGKLVVELLILVTGLALSRGRGVRLAAAGWWLLLLLQINEAVGLVLMNQAPLYYDELFLLRHAAVLAGDLWEPAWLGRAAAGVLAAAALAAAVAWAWRQIAWRLAQPGRARWLILGGLWIFVAAAAWQQGVGFSWRRTARWLSPAAAENLLRSAALYHQVRDTLTASPYEAYRELALERRPDVHLFVVESYGRLLVDHPELSGDYRAALEELEQALAGAGWAAASTSMVAPVSGGRSWLADASLLLGARVQYESLYRHILSQIDGLPSLVRFFSDHGYRTVLIAPKDRARPGVRLANPFGYDTTVFFAELDYPGPAWGWGWIPDEYSLLFAHEHWLRRAAPTGGSAPVFSFFHMVSSHAPWDAPPPLLGDWRAFDRGELPADDLPAGEEIRKRLKRYKRAAAETHYMGELSPLTAEAYARTIRYDLEVIRDYVLERADPDDLFIVLGDHQPPVLDQHSHPFLVPIHLIARDPELLERFTPYGFQPGLWPGQQAEPALRHEGFFSMLVRELVAAWGSSPPPDWLPGGAPLGADP